MAHVKLMVCWPSKDVDAVPTVEVEPWPPLPPTEEEAVVWPPLPPGSPPKSEGREREVSALETWIWSGGLVEMMIMICRRKGGWMFLKRPLILGASRFVLQEDLASEWDLLLVLLRSPSMLVWPPEDGDYAQTLTFRGDGKIVQQPQLSDSAWRVSDRMYVQDVPMLLNLVPQAQLVYPSWENEQMSLFFERRFHLIQASIFRDIRSFPGASASIWCNCTLRWSCLEAVWVLLQLPTMDRWAKYRTKWQETWKSDRRWRLQTKARLEWRVWCDGHGNSHAAMTVCCEWANSFASFWTMWWVSGF